MEMGHGKSDDMDLATLARRWAFRFALGVWHRYIPRIH